MTLPGGAANKLGNRYEKLWTMAEIIRLLSCETQSIHIEPPNIEKVEFVVEVGDHQEFHQAKRSHSNGKWSLHALKGDGLLQTIGRLLKGTHNRFVFVSGSDAPELSDLSNAVNDAESIEEFKKYFLAAQHRKRAFQELQKRSIWDCHESTAFQILRRIEIRTIDEFGLKQRISDGIKLNFIDDPEKIFSALNEIIESSIYRTITREQVFADLNDRGFHRRQLSKPTNAVNMVQTATDFYLEDVQKKLIQGRQISSIAAQKLLNRLKCSVGDSVLTGRAGTGKTASLVQVIAGLRETGHPVLAFRLDRLPHLPTTTELGKYLNLEVSPVSVLAEAAKHLNRPGVLIIDQLDTCSTLSGRHTGTFELVESLLREVQNFGLQLSIYSVLVCRQFDWMHDSRLKNLKPDADAQIRITQFTLEEVASVLTESNFDPNKFQNSQLELLRLPQNLSLFLDSNFDNSHTPSFRTTKELYERYWEEKRRSVADRVSNSSDQWMPVVQTLCSEITSTRQLSVAREKLDSISSVYLDQMASEGVITFDGKRYGFGHESFLDYCFARIFVSTGKSLVSFLVDTEQHLFHRAQVRQVLVYLRDADFNRYISEINGLLCSKDIRPHIKDLVFVLLANVDNPTLKEWEIWLKWIQPEIEAKKLGMPNPNRLSVRGWQRFNGSNSWFTFLAKQDVIKTWLNSDNNQLSGVAVNYLRVHHSHSPDEVAAFLEPYADRGDNWPARLCQFMEWVNFHKSRRLFNLFLQLIDIGTLDRAKGPIAVNSTFWSMLYSLGEERSDWFSEALAHRLRRQLKIFSTDDSQSNSFRPIGHDRSAVELISKSAEADPSNFVNNILPVVLEISDSNLVNSAPPKRDAVWPVLILSKYSSGEQTCLQKLAESLTKLAKSCFSNLQELIALLRERDSYVANYLLLSLYEGNAKRFAQEAIDLLCKEPWRLQCGFTDSPNWCSMKVIQISVAHCTVASRMKLEKIVLDYYPPSEISKISYTSYNTLELSQFNLLSAIPAKLRGSKASARFIELEQKFGSPSSEPRGIIGGFVRSPIEKTAADKMTDDQWLNAISKYWSEDPTFKSGDSFRGGAQELAIDLAARTKENPERFARLSLKFPTDSNPVYLDRILAGLKESEIPSSLKLKVCCKAYENARNYCGMSIVDSIGSIKDTLPNEAVSMLSRIATEYEESDSGSNHNVDSDDLESIGINTTRGRAAIAIATLIIHDPQNVELFRKTLERMVQDESAAVLTCVARTLSCVAYCDPPLGNSLFKRMNLNDDRLLAARNIYYFILENLNEYFEEWKSILQRMLQSPVAKVGQAGARLAGIANLRNLDSAELVKEAINGSAHLRLGIAEVASANIAKSEYRQWCESTLFELFNDSNTEVRRESALCFREVESENLDKYSKLISKFCDSKAFQEDSFSIINTFEYSSKLPHDLTCLVCNKFLDRFAHEANDISRSRYVHTRKIVKLVFRIYQQYLNDKRATQALDLIDRLCMEGIIDTEREFEQFDR